jgi:hypothetical protein
MAVSLKQNMVGYLADAAIAKGLAVKIGSDANHIAVCAANTDKAVGIVQNDPDAAEQLAEVAMSGGGAKAKLGETVDAGQMLIPHTDGRLIKPNALGDQIICQALEGGVANDLINVMVIASKATASE